MKAILKSVFVVALATLAWACEDPFKIDYQSPVTISFAGVDSKNMVTVDKGVTTYTASISVSGSLPISEFRLYKASATTGESSTLIQSKDDFEEGATSYAVDYTFQNLEENQCVKVIVSDAQGVEYQRNLLVKITPSVIFTDPQIIETAEVYYGIYFASWLSGRVYMRDKAASYSSEVDFSLGEVDIDGDGVKEPSLVSPAKRGDYGLLNIGGLTAAQFSETALALADFNAVKRVDATPIEQLTDPTLDVVKVEKGKVYLFRTVAGKKGLVYVSEMTSKTATIEVTPGEWVPNTTYNQLKVIVKTIAW